MRKFLLALALLWPTGAWAQCTGVFPANTLCGNLSGVSAPPAAFSSAGTIAGPSSSTSGWIPAWANSLGTQLGNQSSITTSQAFSFQGIVGISSAFTVTSTTSFTAATSFTGLTNFTSQFQVNGNRIQFPVGPDTVGGLGTNQNWTGTNSFTGLTSISVLSLGSSISTTVPLSASIGGTGHTSLFVPTTQYFTTGTSLTYTTPSNPAPIYIVIEMCGGGGGGGAQVTNPGSAGTSTAFANWVAGPGQGGGAGSSAGGNGGTGGVNGPGTQILRQAGGAGSGSGGTGGAMEGLGGISFIGGYAAAVTAGGVTGKSPQTNSCGGGSGGATLGTAAGSGGGAGEYVRFQIVAPASAYIYTIGNLGNGGGAGTEAGGNGASGFALVREFYQ